MNCKNCGHIISGNFCSHCGQSSSIGQINLSNFISEISETIFQINKGLFFTIKELFLRPGHMLNGFLSGKRQNHFKPIAYVVTLSTFYFLITQITNQNTWIDDIITGWMNSAVEKSNDIKGVGLLTLFSKNYAYTTLLLLPIFSFASFLSFKKFDKNYLEHIVINSYITGHQALLYSTFALIGLFFKNDIVEIASLLVAITYAFWVYIKLFNNGKSFIVIFRSLMTYFLYVILSTGLLFLVMSTSLFNN